MPLTSGATLDLPVDVRDARDKLEEFLSAADWSGDIDVTLIAVQEALINAERHGSGLRQVATRLRRGTLEVQVADCGAPFDPSPYAAREPDLFAERGRGWWLITQIATHVEISSEPEGSRVTLVFAPESDRPADAAVAPLSVPGLVDLGVRVLAALGAVAIITDAHLVVREVAGATMDLLGLTPEEVVGRDFRGYASEIKDRFADPAAFEDRLLDSYAHLDRTVVELFALADGRTIRRHGVPILDDDGTPTGRLGIYVPISDTSGDLIGRLEE